MNVVVGETLVYNLTKKDGNDWKNVGKNIETDVSCKNGTSVFFTETSKVNRKNSDNNNNKHDPRREEFTMRIEAYTQVQQVYKSNKAACNKNVKKAKFTDAVEISSLGKDIQVAKQAVKNAPDVREDLVASYKEQITAGTYSVSAEQLANKLLSQAGV